MQLPRYRSPNAVLLTEWRDTMSGSVVVVVRISHGASNQEVRAQRLNAFGHKAHFIIA
jgi:hypothetical protein